MFNASDFAAMLFLRHAREKQRLYTGQLYTPAEIAKISADRGDVLHPTWHLGGQVPSAMFQDSRLRQDYRHSARLYQSPGGLLYGVVGQQLGCWEHRFVVQLMGDQFESFIRESHFGPLWVSLADANGPLATVLAGPDDMHLTLPAGTEVPCLPTDFDDVVNASADCMRMATLLLHPGEHPAPPGWPSIKHVCLSLVQPPEFLGQMEALAAHAEGGRRQ